MPNYKSKQLAVLETCKDCKQVINYEHKGVKWYMYGPTTCIDCILKAVITPYYMLGIKRPE